jgi:hypothetical protein
MKRIVLLLITVVLVTAAGAELIYAQSFAIADAAIGLPSTTYGASYMLADDFAVPCDSTVDRVIIWGIFQEAQQMSDFWVRLFTDDGGEPGPELAEIFVGANYITFTDTGEAFGTAEIFEIDMDLTAVGEELDLEAGQQYWFSAQAQYDYLFYWVCPLHAEYEMVHLSSDDGDTWESSYEEWEEEYDAFFELHGDVTAVQPASWGRIKALD